ncbi:MAG: response regulator [Acidobacteriota bacterium]|jgi:CheY-like chemotaxis protein
MQDGKYVILVLDDDPDILESLRVILEANGYAVASASSAEEGLRVYKSAKPDLLFVDLMMEEIDAGMTFVKEVRALNNTAPIYVLSSVGDNLSMMTDFSALGLTGVLQKPIKSELLLKLLKSKLK